MIDCKWIQGARDLADVLAIRRVVFIEEQNVPYEEEGVPGEDEASWHLIVYSGGAAAATGRIFMNEGRFILQRIAVLKEFRGRGLGKLVTRKLIDKAFELGAKIIDISSQTHALSFYEAFGFKAYGEEYLDAGIAHYSMKLQ
ncbi:MAG: GNAT family N-acetyltransferase [Clostridiales bacterium]|jgi:predicted GNAT family N-acyltransferase|nr:GNAT family N-acetyltransferase [Clostridiales bacterium]